VLPRRIVPRRPRLREALRLLDLDLDRVLRPLFESVETAGDAGDSGGGGNLFGDASSSAAAVSVTVSVF